VSTGIADLLVGPLTTQLITSSPSRRSEIVGSEAVECCPSLDRNSGGTKSHVRGTAWIANRRIGGNSGRITCKIDRHSAGRRTVRLFLQVRIDHCLVASLSPLSVHYVGPQTTGKPAHNAGDGKDVDYGHFGTNAVHVQTKEEFLKSNGPAYAVPAASMRGSGKKNRPGAKE